MPTRPEPAPRRTQQERAAESALRLREALAELVIEQGYERTTAAEIGQRAGYSRAMVRERYQSKDELLFALQGEYADRLLTPSTREGGESSGLSELAGGFERLRLFAAEHPTLLKAIFIASFEAAGGGHVMRPEVRRWLDALGGAFGAWIRTGQHDGSISAAVDADDEVEQLLVEAIGLAYRWTQVDDVNAFAPRVDAWRGRVLARLRS